MIMPDKNIRIEYSMLNCGAIVLSNLRERDTISSLWEKCREKETLVNYERFILTLDYLFVIGAVRLDSGLIERCQND